MLKNKIIVVCGGLGRIGFNLTKEILKNEGTVICADINDSNSFKCRLNNNLYFRVTFIKI